MSEEKYKELIESGPSLRSSQEWKKINAGLRDGLHGVNAKMEIGHHDLYIKTDWYDGRIVRIDVTLSRGKDTTDDLPKSEHTMSLETTRFDLARSWIENECRMASDLLQTGEAGIGDVIDEWVAVEGYPSGYCKQLPGVNLETGEVGPTFQRGPLHAVAMLIKRRLVAWSEFVKKDQSDG